MKGGQGVPGRHTEIAGMQVDVITLAIMWWKSDGWLWRDASSGTTVVIVVDVGNGG